MPCLLVLLALIAPRVVAVVLWLFSPTFYDPAFTGRGLLLIAGIVLLPFTTLAYAWVLHAGWALGSAGSLVLLVIAVLADLSSLAGSRRRSTA